MAYYGQLRPIPEGNFTQTIYGLIKENKMGEAIAYLQQELQVRGGRPRVTHVRVGQGNGVPALGRCPCSPSASLYCASSFLCDGLLACSAAPERVWHRPSPS